jgi:hypothetical protein
MVERMDPSPDAAILVGLITHHLSDPAHGTDGAQPLIRHDQPSLQCPKITLLPNGKVNPRCLGPFGHRVLFTEQPRQSQLAWESN